jgi:hypothetical protein
VRSHLVSFAVGLLSWKLGQLRASGYCCRSFLKQLQRNTERALSRSFPLVGSNPPSFIREPILKADLSFRHHRFICIATATLSIQKMVSKTMLNSCHITKLQDWSGRYHDSLHVGGTRFRRPIMERLVFRADNLFNDLSLPPTIFLEANA